MLGIQYRSAQIRSRILLPPCPIARQADGDDAQPLQQEQRLGEVVEVKEGDHSGLRLAFARGFWQREEGDFNCLLTRGLERKPAPPCGPGFCIFA
jgi:hypothetical protein